MDVVSNYLFIVETIKAKVSQPITLVVVTKTVDTDLALTAVKIGARDLGENRPQELSRKYTLMNHLYPDIRWHMIGSLQKNKVKQVVPIAHLIHSVDSLELLNKIDAEAEKVGKVQNILLQVNISREVSKHGFEIEHVYSVLEHAIILKHISVEGLMTMAPLEAEQEATRPAFRALRELRDQLESHFTPHRLPVLSMGMSNDYKVALEEGSNCIRIGSAIFK